MNRLLEEMKTGQENEWLEENKKTGEHGEVIREDEDRRRR